MPLSHMIRDTMRDSKIDTISVTQSSWNLASIVLACKGACTHFLKYLPLVLPSMPLQHWFQHNQFCGFPFISFSISTGIYFVHSQNTVTKYICHFLNILLKYVLFSLHRQQNLFQQPTVFFSYSYCLRHCIIVSLLKQSYPIWKSIQTSKIKEKGLSQAVRRLLFLLFADISLVLSLYCLWT